MRGLLFMGITRLATEIIRFCIDENILLFILLTFKSSWLLVFMITRRRKRNGGGEGGVLIDFDIVIIKATALNFLLCI